jgi:hypothetical protein
MMINDLCISGMRRINPADTKVRFILSLPTISEKTCHIPAPQQFVRRSIKRYLSENLTREKNLSDTPVFVAVPVALCGDFSAGKCSAGRPDSL